MRKTTHLLLTISAASAVVLATSSVAYAAPASFTGGCGGVSNGMKACISASGSSLLSDGYTSGLPSNCTTVFVSILTQNGSSTGISGSSGCGNGRHPGQTLSNVHGTFFARIVYQAGSNYSAPVDSPKITV